jgi:MYXO-CTERM domain-containing protein
MSLLALRIDADPVVTGVVVFAVAALAVAYLLFRGRRRR